MTGSLASGLPEITGSWGPDTGATLGEAMSPRRAAVPTPDEIWRILRSIARERRREERITRRRDRIARQRDRALERRFRREEEVRQRAAAELEARLREEEAERKREEAERKREEAERKREQTERDRKLEKMLNRIAGDGDHRWGQLMEALVGGDLVSLLQRAGLDVEVLGRDVRSQNREGVWREYDLVAAGTSLTVVVEVKTTLRARDVTKFVSRLGDFREWRPDYARPRMYGALGYLTAKGDATRAAEAAGFYLIRAVGSNASIVNSKGFEPRLY